MPAFGTVISTTVPLILAAYSRLGSRLSAGNVIGRYLTYSAPRFTTRYRAPVSHCDYFLERGIIIIAIIIAPP